MFGQISPRRPEVWFTDTRRLFWVGVMDPQRIVHWKGFALYVVLAAIIFLAWIAAAMTSTLHDLWWKIVVAIAIGWFLWVKQRHTEYLDDC